MDPEHCPVCGQADNCGDCNHYGTRHYIHSGHRDPDVCLYDPVTVTMIARRLNVRTSVITNWRMRHETFPAPALELIGARVWEWTDIEQWLADRA